MEDKNIAIAKEEQQSDIVLGRVSEIARNALKKLISEQKPALPLYYEKSFYHIANEMGEIDLIHQLSSTLPLGQKATSMVAGVSSVISNLDDEIRNFRKDIDSYGRNLEKEQDHIQQIAPHDVWVILEKHLADLKNANQQMKDQIELTESRLKQQEKKVSQLQRESRRDPLTGAMNRMAMEEDLSNEFARSQRYNRVFSVIMADIDHFKKVNDTYGHAIGDEVLKFFVQQLSNLLRSVDFIYRYGGEEFLIFLPETHIDGALLVAERLRKSIDTSALKHRDDPSITFRVTSSFGVSSVDKSDNNHMDSIKRADKALYNAKNTGRNKVDSIQLYAS